MKKVALFSLLAFTLTVVSARPPIEGDVLDGNDFVFGIDVSADTIARKGGYSTPYLQGKIDGQYITYSTFSKNKNNNSSQFDATLNLNARYGLFDYFEIFANANGYYQYSDIDTGSPIYKDFNPKANIVNFGGANIGLMATLYKGESFHVVIGDNSDIITNTMFADFKSQMKYFGGHTFFINFVEQYKADGEKFASFTSQFYYRLNLNQKYKFSSDDGEMNHKFKAGDEAGVRFLWQVAKENSLMFIGANVAFRASDRRDGEKLPMVLFSGQDYNGMGVGFSVGTKRDINAHLGYKIAFNYMNYSLDYNSNTAGLTFGLYFK
ncbi:hypothetical protein BKH42_03345 [Helicobacter sp. 13S00482-2]|uniref:hypothetical protein n=1 Tax=Helicobacter sp. 13S00482-2 TaxID=1476200 RepID=UPI000BA567E7|nr:hypothetical protein [Helicobacter sp. 13S00482-2]PAF54014.1 hypothetical protein BKH42_03345 [Helicobacter sp. 13S00482-2]